MGRETNLAKLWIKNASMDGAWRNQGNEKCTFLDQYAKDKRFAIKVKNISWKFLFFFWIFSKDINQIPL